MSDAPVLAWSNQLIPYRYWFYPAGPVLCGERSMLIKETLYIMLRSSEILPHSLIESLLCKGDIDTPGTAAVDMVLWACTCCVCTCGSMSTLMLHYQLLWTAVVQQRCVWHACRLCTDTGGGEEYVDQSNASHSPANERILAIMPGRDFTQDWPLLPTCG